MKLRSRFPLKVWDLRQFKESTDDWIAAFKTAVHIRSQGTKHRPFLGLSGGHDSGAIACVLTEQRTPFDAYSVESFATKEQHIAHQRARFFADIANTTWINLASGAPNFDMEKAHLIPYLEPYLQEVKDSQKNGLVQRRLLYEDPATVGLSSVARRARSTGTLIYLSGQGSDEIISDYADGNGTKHAGLSCFSGTFPEDLAAGGFFPWCNFYKGAQRSFLMKEELVTGVYGIEGRYPFLDPKVVQEFLWLKHTVKNSQWKRPITDLLAATNFPRAKKKISGFSPKRSRATMAWQTVKGKLCWLAQPLTGSDCWR